MRPPYPTDRPTPTPPEQSGGNFGLSTAHIGTDAPRPPSIKAYSRGGMIAIDPGDLPRRSRAGGGKRRAISGFSKNSRRRLLRLIGTIDQTQTLPLFVTLTYPAEYPTARASKQHLKAFFRLLRQYYPKSSGIWKLEAQQRGAPHYHLLLWGIRYFPKDVCARMWWHVCGEISEDHLKAGTQVCRAGQFKRVWLYAGKYLAKVGAAPTGPTWEKPGRFWGIFNAALLPISPAYQFPISDRVLYTMRRYARRKLGRSQHSSSLRTVYLFTDNPVRWAEVAIIHRQI